jgi:hypothetical protein
MPAVVPWSSVASGIVVEKDHGPVHSVNVFHLTLKGKPEKWMQMVISGYKKGRCSPILGSTSSVSSGFSWFLNFAKSEHQAADRQRPYKHGED